MCNNPGKVFGIYDVAESIDKVYNTAFSTNNITNGFEVAGIFSMNERVFNEEEFLSSYVTDRPLVSDNNATTGNQSIDQSENIVPNQQIETYLPPEAIKLFPKAARKTFQTGRQKGKTRILTDTPEKNEIKMTKPKKPKTYLKKKLQMPDV